MISSPENAIVSNTRKPTSLYFIHIPKNMGNFIYRNYFDLNQEDKTRFYGLYDSIYNYYDMHNMKYNKLIDTEPYPSVSIDHLTLLELVNLRIMNYYQVQKYLFFAIIREPVDRFISLCNYWDVSPDQLIYNIERIHLLKKSKYNLFQHLRCQSDYIYSIHRVTKNYRIFSMDKRDEIREFLKTYFPDKDVNFEEKIYPSREKYTKSSLSRKNIDFLNNYYKTDFELYNKAS